MITDKLPKNTAWEGSKIVQTAGVRMAWEGTFSVAEVERKKAASLEQQWWTRYKSLPDAEKCPSDYGVTTALRQLRSRRLVQPNMLAMETLHRQKLQRRVRHQLGVAGGRSLELVEGEAIEDKELEETVDSYFLGVELWALSFAKAGITACDPLPGVAETPG